MPHIPTEVLLAIGELLDGRSLVACLQVTQDWHDTLRHFVWTTISERQWTHYDFPPASWIPLIDYDGPLIASQEQRKAKVEWGLQQTRSLTFYNNNALANKLHWCRKSRLPRQILMIQLVHVVQRTPNLVRFSLVMMYHGPDDINLATMLELLHKMPKLEAVEIDLPYRRRLAPIKGHFRLFARLKELKIGGDWYRGVKTLGPAPDKTMPWNLKHLTIDRLDMSFFRFCPSLERLTFSSFISGYSDPETLEVREVIVGQLRQLTKLVTIIFEENYHHPEYEYKIQKEKTRTGEDRWALTSDDVVRIYSLVQLLHMI
ncbi:hypothetical protein EC957_010580 [Mortierella hygrophila]|uniref:F-box domain-containing protein n=1 Tax=Mortierella hygrophila TaxID=979708 RepID=A0A9P6F9Q2_9FUNG|nr:hypothetical protein EC957_010580 [Mortierella hygrophila]